MGFSITGAKSFNNQTVTAAMFKDVCLNSTAMELHNCDVEGHIDCHVPFAATDSFIPSLNAYNNDFEMAELDPNLVRIEHTTINELSLSSCEVCDIIDESHIKSLICFGHANVKFRSEIDVMKVMIPGTANIYDATIEQLHVYGTVILNHAKVHELYIHLGGRVFTTDPLLNMHSDRAIAEGDVEMTTEDPYVFTPFSNKMRYYYG